MGVLETNSAKKTRKTKVTKAILTVVAAAGIISVAIAAPNTLSLLGRAMDRYSKRNIGTAAKRLVERGLLRTVRRNGLYFYEITKAGTVYLNSAKSYVVSKPAKWDGKWRIVTFDIAQSRSDKRSLLRQTLREIGFERLQDSVWIFPYDCEDLITLLKTDYGLGKEVLYIIADSIENDRALRKNFGLKAR